MDDKPTNEEPKKDFNKLDLTQLQSFSFGTEWTKEKSQPGGGSQRRDDPTRRDGPADDRRDRRGFKRSAGPTPGGGGGAPGGGRDRRPSGGRPEGQGRGPGGPRGDGQGRGPGGPRGGGDRRGGGRPMPEGPYISPYFDATFYPEDVSFAALAKTIRSSARTFELFDIAKTVIGKNDRFVCVLERKTGKVKEGEAKKLFFVCLLDGLPFETEEAAMNHVVQKHLERFFHIREEEGEPPKGSFQVINRCGVTGALLGPPNYHLYNQIVQQHHATHLPRMGFENFSSRIESVRDEEVVAEWLESMKKVTRYTWLGDANVPTKPEEPASAEKPAEKPAEATAPAETPPAAEAPASADDTPAEVAAEPAAPAEESETATEEVSTEAASEASAEPAPVAEAPVAPTPVTEPTFDSISEVRVHLITLARDKCIRTYEHGRFHGRAISDMPDGEIKHAVLGALERQQRFPLDTANALRGRLRREGFTIFKKGSKGISYVSAVKRKFRIAGQSFADSINGLITFVETNPMVKVSELTEKFLKIVPPESPKSDGETPTATAPSTVSPFGADDQLRIKRMQLDLRWLVTEGYVTEFIDGSLFAAPPMPLPKPKPKPEPKVEKKAVPTDSDSTKVPPVEVAPTAKEPAPTASAPVESTPSEPAPAVSAPTEASPVEPAAVESVPAAPAEVTPVASPVEAEPVAIPVESPATESSVAPTEPVETPEAASAVEAPVTEVEVAPAVAETEPVSTPVESPAPESLVAPTEPVETPEAAPAEEAPVPEVEVVPAAAETQPVADPEPVADAPAVEQTEPVVAPELAVETDDSKEKPQS
ncbi:MAG: hypothetical protein QNL51_16800 [Opitutaceae bacterium]